MTIHREGYRTIGIAALLFGVINVVSFSFLTAVLPWLPSVVFIVTLILLLFIVSFFRIPSRLLTVNENQIICPADGKVVVIEETVDVEYFKDKRIQVSIFMSPANVHQNRNPIGGEVIYSQHFNGKYLVAWYPKSSTENERWSVAVKNNHGTILYKQIAGAMARRICNYISVGQQVTQADEFGFIKFGSRVDVLLPIGTEVNVQLNQSVKGGVTVLATWK